jgi:integrase
MSSLLSHYTQNCKSTSVKIWWARYAIVGIQTIARHLKGRLKRAWDTLKAWQLQLPVRNRAPIPLEIVNSMALVLVERGCRHRYDLPACFSCALLVRVGFHALCRPGELLNLTVGDINLSLEGDLPTVLAIGDPKNRGALGRAQFRLVRDAGTTAWLRWFTAGLPPSTKLWGSSAAAFRKLWNWSLETLELDGMHFTPGCLRPGGTTHQFRSGVPIQTLKYHGGWCSDRSLACYVQEAMAALVWHGVQPSVAQAIHAKSAQGAPVLDSAPSVPWPSLLSPRPLRGRLPKS